MTEPDTSVAPMFSKEFHIDPFPTYARMRDEGPVHRVVTPDGVEQWVVTRYDEARAALNDNRLSRNPRYAAEALRKSGVYQDTDADPEPNVLNMDPPDHTRLRKVVARAFTRRRVETLRPWVQRIADELLDAIGTRDRAELIEEYATPLPMTVACALLGVSEEDSGYLQELSIALLTPAYTGNAAMPSYEAGRLIQQYFSERVPEKAELVRPGAEIEEQPDLLCAMIAASREQGRLTEAELVAMAMLLMVAGFETTAGLIGTGTMLLLREPDQLRLLRERPELFPNAIDEFVRYDGPAERAMIRVATEDIQIGGVTVPKGGIVAIALSSADRDPRRFTDPDEVDIARTDRSHLGFGHGVHFCIGAPLARLEGGIALRSLFDRYPGLALDCAPEDLQWRQMGVMRGLERLPLKLSGRRFPPPAGAALAIGSGPGSRAQSGVDAAVTNAASLATPSAMSFGSR